MAWGLDAVHPCFNHHKHPVVQQTLHGCFLSTTTYHPHPPHNSQTPRCLNCLNRTACLVSKPSLSRSDRPTCSFLYHYCHPFPPLCSPAPYFLSDSITVTSLAVLCPVFLCLRIFLCFSSDFTPPLDSKLLYSKDRAFLGTSSKVFLNKNE